jgi:hypothetical protein
MIEFLHEYTCVVVMLMFKLCHIFTKAVGTVNELIQDEMNKV